MDSITHVVLGACIAEVMVAKAGKRVLIAGAVAQSLPDIDFVTSFWLSPASDLLAHRGFTHSFLFCLLAAPAMALLTDRFFIRGTHTLRAWTLFYLGEILLHVFLDAFNAYGVAWFEPFAHTRISFNALFVADPFLTTPILLACVFLLFSSRSSVRRRPAALLAVAWFIVFLSYTLLVKAAIDRSVTASFQAQNLQVSKYFSTPTPLNTWLWYIVANTDNGSYVGYRSVFDTEDSIGYEFFPRLDVLLEPVADHDELQYLKRFSDGYYTVESWGDTLVFNDLRFGQMIGWRDRRARFVFHFYLNYPNDNKLVVQRGRFAGWNNDEARSLVVRALGTRLTGRALPAENRK